VELFEGCQKGAAAELPGYWTADRFATWSCSMRLWIQLVPEKRRTFWQTLFQSGAGVLKGVLIKKMKQIPLLVPKAQFGNALLLKPSFLRSPNGRLYES